MLVWVSMGSVQRLQHHCPVQVFLTCSVWSPLPRSWWSALPLNARSPAQTPGVSRTVKGATLQGESSGRNLEPLFNCGLQPARCPLDSAPSSQWSLRSNMRKSLSHVGRPQTVFDFCSKAHRGISFLDPN